MSQHATAPAATFGHALRSEWQKMASLKSFWYTLVLTAVVGVGIGSLASLDAAQTYRNGADARRAAFDPTYESLFTGLIFGMLAMVVLGVLAMTSEYSTGMIRTSLAAVPRRGRLLAAKATVVTLAGLTVGIPVGFAMFFAGQGVFAAQDVPFSTLDQPGVLRAVVGVGLVMTAVALLGLGVGTLVRATAGGIAVMFTATLLVPTAILPSLPSVIGKPLLKFWPSSAGMQVLSPEGNPGFLPPLGGLLWLYVVAAIVLAVTFAVFRSRDV
ncbi:MULTISPECIES: ABC transporter permease [unclassified Crossiella]|uniref:ABC transporter permease n=1 Tax=unclassified Crossiella TaxID=2620835 RepID=UPI001FFEF7A2|nr:MULTISPECIES: ABC transporter permease [unclassified Crossiella]MCK2244444.1 ABC transporter permease [Crossiella sp. S99.2]MCK2258075.1 ABC transporter permease [Crossiella sp. S99.1]